MTAEYNEYLQSPEWKKIRQIVKKRDGKVCRYCGSSKSLRVHHLTYEHIFNETDFLEDLITLCADCHKKVHSIIDKPVRKKKKQKKGRQPRTPRPKLERKTVRRAFIINETDDNYKVKLSSNNQIWDFDKKDCNIISEYTYKNRDGIDVFTIEFPLSFLKKMRANRKKKPIKPKYSWQ